MPRMQVFKIFPAALLVTATVFGSAALAQIIFDKPKAPDPNEREVSLVRQDLSDCANTNVSDQDPSGVGGTAWVVRSGGTTSVKVAITGKPNTTYHFHLKCVRILGDIKTWDEGEGQGTFSFSTSEIGNTFAFDMYPEGAPAGNKFQSVTVRY
jgi:hypothetical protein